jgi:two-component system sensor histidine kinase PilS (NtrC family)
MPLECSPILSGMGAAKSKAVARAAFPASNARVRSPILRRSARDDVAAQRYQDLDRGSTGDITRRELYFFNLYRCLEALVYASLFLAPFGSDSVRIARPLLGQSVALLYLAAAFILLSLTAQLRRSLASTIAVSLGIDIIAAAAVLFALTGYGLVPMMLLVNIGIAALLMPRHAYYFALGAAIGVAAPYVYSLVGGEREPANGLLVLAMAIAYFVVATLLRHLGGHLRAAEDLAEQRGADLLNLEQINDLIIQRMRTGVLLVDRANFILRINESAWHLIGNPSPGSANSASSRRNCRGASTTGATTAAPSRPRCRWPRTCPR